MDTQSLKSVGDSSVPLPQPDKVSRQEKTIDNIIPTNYLGCGQGKNKSLNSQASYHGLISVLIKATGGAIGR